MKYKIGDRVYLARDKFLVINVIALSENSSKVLIKDEQDGSALWASDDQLKPIVRCSNDA
ncbi:hypothetical protein [Acinetobacter phage HFM1]|nr:hypothetical protein [Acinetobacter phage HFM1]